MNVKINNKNYTVPTLGFREITKMEQVAGASIINVLQTNQIFVICTSFVSVVANCDVNEAERLCEQHIMGGGEIGTIYEAFNKAAEDSSFLKKLLKIEELQKKSSKSTQTEA